MVSGLPQWREIEMCCISAKVMDWGTERMLVFRHSRLSLICIRVAKGPGGKTTSRTISIMTGIFHCGDTLDVLELADYEGIFLLLRGSQFLIFIMF